jgi:hypothetical protein
MTIIKKKRREIFFVDRTPQEASPFALKDFCVNLRIVLTDRDHRDQQLEAEIVAYDRLSLRLAVPNTAVQFDMRRAPNRNYFEGALGGRTFRYTPGDAA